VTDKTFIEIACDESGSDGENLISGSSRIFAHGSTDLTSDEASCVIADLRGETAYAGSEVKSSRLLKGQHLAHTLRRFEPGGALRGRVRVSITDKAYMAVCKVVDLVIEEDAYRRGIQLHQFDIPRRIAQDLFAEGPRAYGTEMWGRLLHQFVSFVRTKQRQGVKTPIEELLATLDELRLVSRRNRVGTAMQLLWQGRAELEAYAASDGSHLENDLPTLDPLIPSLMQTAGEWHRLTGRSIWVVHDRQSVLNDETCAILIGTGCKPHPDFPIKVPIAGISQVDSRTDPRIQVADIVAGLGALAGRTALDGKLEASVRQAVQPILISSSLWGDTASWERLSGDSKS
jgi:hypothetical protein